MTKKAIIALMLVLSVFVTLLLPSCSRNDDTKSGEIKLGISVYDEHDAFISLLVNEFMEDVKNYNETSDKQISVLRYSAAGNQSTQNYQVSEMIDKGCDVLLVNLVDRTDASTIIETARKNNTPIVFFNRELVAEDLYSWNRLYYVGGDATLSGVLQGQIVTDAIRGNKSVDKNHDGKIQYVVMEGEAGHQDAIVRSESSVNTLIDNGIVLDKLESAIANWKRNQAQSKMNIMIDKYGSNIELVLCNNDEMALGVIDEYDSRKIDSADRPLIVGIDGTDMGLQAVLDGKMYGTVYNDKEGQARSMVDISIALATDSSLDAFGLESGIYKRLPYDIVTRDNINKYLSETAEEN